MLDFRRIEMSDFPALRKMYEKYGNWSCDCTICGTYMWRDYLDIRISLEEEKLIVYQQLDGKHLFYIPLMEDRIAGGAGWTTSPLGLLTTMTSSSS